MSLLESFHQAAARSPRAPALRTPEGDVSYAELVERVHGLARALQDRDVGPRCRVAIHLERSAELIVALLAALAAGAAYVPLDPSVPEARRRGMLADSECALLLGRGDAQPLSAAAGIPRLDPADWPVGGKAEPVLHPGPAYILYTSGSTGGPKGVVVGRGALENYLAWCLASLPFTGGGVPLFASIAFDHSVTCIYPPLLQGEPLALLPPIDGGRALAAGLLTGQRYSFVKITPSHFGFLDREERARLGRSTALLMFGGERLTPALVAEARRDHPALAVMNHYGPTEATVGCCVYRLPLAGLPERIPIGEPIPHVTASVRRADRSEAGTGEPGELWIGGAALAQGYWRRPESTAERFVAAPPGEGGARWYRTGDAVRRRADGALEYLGRLDDQLKILGHRIEPLEVEQALAALPGVTDAAVLGQERDGAVRLVAAAAVRDPALTGEALRQKVRERLPAPMVPSRIVVLDRLPVTRNGKLDRHALLALLDRREPAAEATVETLLAERFALALGVPRVEPDDDFFELGGDSMATVEIAAWAAERFRVPLEPSALFEHPSVSTLARHVRALVGAEGR